MALRKEPHRRYLSVEQFSEDIGRYLEGRPVIARLDTPGYQLTKFLRRNGEGVAAAVIIGVALISIAIVSHNSEVVDAVARQKAEIALQLTRHELVAAYLHGGELSRAYTAAQIAYSAAPGRPFARRDLAQAAQALGDEREAGGDHREALRLYTEELTQYEALALTSPGDPGAQRDLMATANMLGTIQLKAGDVRGALSSYTRALQITEGLATLEGSQITSATREEVAAANRRVGELLMRTGAKEAGLEKLRRALEIYRQLSANPEIAELTRQLAQ
jgi:tetratricopeptide (TPR) repeat protein